MQNVLIDLHQSLRTHDVFFRELGHMMLGMGRLHLLYPRGTQRLEPGSLTRSRSLFRDEDL